MPPVQKHIADHRCAYLLASLVVFLITGAFTKPTLAGELVELSVFLLVMISAISSMSDRRHARLTASALAAPFVVIYILGYTPVTGDADRTSLVGASASLPFLAMAFWTTLGYTMQRAPITTDRLYGAAAAFLLLALVWAGFYSIAELAWPGSFRIPPELPFVVWNDLVYFSLVTQTTLGYGDITPAGYLARTLAVLHACAGLFYMGAIVAYLVAAYSRPAEPPGGP